VSLQQPRETFVRAIVERGGLATKIEWVFDSAFRFFPVEPDLGLGWRPVCPDPSSPDFAKLARHFGSIKGAWPCIVQN
jgi:hypothetical protein